MRTFSTSVFSKLFVIGMIAISTSDLSSQSITKFSKSGGEYTRLLDSLTNMLTKQQRKRELLGKERTVFVPWIRDHVHVMKAMKFLSTDISSHLELFLETQTAEGMYFDYYYPIEAGVSRRMNIFDNRYWEIYSREKMQMHRLPIEADLEYLMVEGVYYVWQATGDQSFVKKWLPALEKGLNYCMSDPLRWSSKYLLVKRGYTIDTWDFMQLPGTRKEYTSQGFDVEKGIFNIDTQTPMGIMHGDNSGMYAACRQMAEMCNALGLKETAAIWDAQADAFRTRTNYYCWNGHYYSHFIEDDPQPAYLKADQKNTLSLSNPYDINRGLPTEEMAESIIQTYLDLKEKTTNESFAEWFGIYPAIKPHFADYEPGSYVNGGVLTIVAGELAKAAFQHGYENYGIDILDRILKLVDKYKGKLPVGYKPDGTVDSGIPDNWGQAAVYSAMIEGLAGVVDKGCLLKNAEISPRWMAANVDNIEVEITYGPSEKKLKYAYQHNKAGKQISLKLSGDAEKYCVRLMLPEGKVGGKAEVDGDAIPSKIEQIRTTKYLVIENIKGGNKTIKIFY